MALCWYCNKRDNESNDSEDPCSVCDTIMETQIILFSYSEELTKDERFPFRTGQWTAVTEEYLREKIRFFPQPEIERVMQQRCMVLDDSWWELWGLPKATVH
jgi:hypothetical protein